MRSLSRKKSWKHPSPTNGGNGRAKKNWQVGSTSGWVSSTSECVTLCDINMKLPHCICIFLACRRSSTPYCPPDVVIIIAGLVSPNIVGLRKMCSVGAVNDGKCEFIGFHWHHVAPTRFSEIIRLNCVNWPQFYLLSSWSLFRFILSSAPHMSHLSVSFLRRWTLSISCSSDVYYYC